MDLKLEILRLASEAYREGWAKGEAGIELKFQDGDAFRALMAFLGTVVIEEGEDD